MFQTTNQAVNNISGWWYTYPSEKYESQLGLLFPHIYIYISPIKIPFNPHLQKAARRRRSPLQNPQTEAAEVLRTPARHNEGTCAAALERCEKGGFHGGKWWKMPCFFGFTSKKWWTCGFWMVLSEKHMMNMWISRANCHENWDVTGQKSCTRNWNSSTEIERFIFWNMVSVAKNPSLAEISSNWDFPFDNHGMLATWEDKSGNFTSKYGDVPRGTWTSATSRSTHQNCSGFTWIYPIKMETNPPLGKKNICRKPETSPIWGCFLLHSPSFGDGSKPCTPGEHQNSWDLWMFIPLKMVLIGIDS